MIDAQEWHSETSRGLRGGRGSYQQVQILFIEDPQIWIYKHKILMFFVLQNRKQETGVVQSLILNNELFYNFYLITALYLRKRIFFIWDLFRILYLRKKNIFHMRTFQNIVSEKKNIFHMRPFQNIISEKTNIFQMRPFQDGHGWLRRWAGKCGRALKVSSCLNTFWSLGSTTKYSLDRTSQNFKKILLVVLIWMFVYHVVSALFYLNALGDKLQL